MIPRIAAYLRGFIGRRRVETEIDEEMAFHLERDIEARIARGMTPAEARRTARRDLGGLTQTTEATRDVRMLWLDTVVRDLQYASRSLLRTPVVTGLAIGMLALGIGANAALFSIADAAFLKPAPYQDPNTLADLYIVSDRGTS